MGFFKKKQPAKGESESPRKSISEIIHERILTAEGWRRKTLKKAKKTK